jgi:hypothetical protein
MVNAVEVNLSDLKDRNYVRRADPKVGYWFSFYVRKMQTMTSRFGDDFFLIVCGAQDIDNDYFVIPYKRVRDVFINENTTGIDSNAKDAKTRTPRWSGNIVNNRLHVTHSDRRIDLTEYYGNRVLLEEAMRHFGDKARNPPELDADAADTTSYDPENISDARNRTMRAITQRRGQKTFRDRLLDAYGRRCAITGCGVVDVLEAAHITPYLGPETNHVENGLLLRADLHTLLDCRLLAIDPANHSVMLAPAVREATDYRGLHGLRLREAVPTAAAPSRKALQQAILACGWFSEVG